MNINLTHMIETRPVRSQTDCQMGTASSAASRTSTRKSGMTGTGRLRNYRNSASTDFPSKKNGNYQLNNGRPLNRVDTVLAYGLATVRLMGYRYSEDSGEQAANLVSAANSYFGGCALLGTLFLLLYPAPASVCRPPRRRWFFLPLVFSPFQSTRSDRISARCRPASAKTG